MQEFIDGVLIKLLLSETGCKVNVVFRKFYTKPDKKIFNLFIILLLTAYETFISLDC